MKSIRPQKRNLDLCRKLTAIFLSVSFILFPPQFMADPPSLLADDSLSYAASPSVILNEAKHPGDSTVSNFRMAGQVSIPSELGRIEESFKGSSDKTVILIQDAHAIPSAQQNIQGLIAHFQNQYNVNLVTLEGADAQLDPQIFKSFPDKELLRKVMSEYQSRGELTGGTAAAIFSAEGGSAPGGNETLFIGIEDWNLYEEGVSFYLQAMEKEPQILKELEAERSKVEKKKKQIYSKELLQADKTLEDFYENHAYLLQVLQKLGTIQEPPAGSELGLLLQESKQQNADDNTVEMEVKQIAQKVESLLKSKAMTTDRKSQLAEFNARYQEFQTSRMTPQAFALILKEIAIKHHLPVKVSSQLSHSMKNQKRMQEIKGTKLFEDFEHYTDQLTESLIQNDRQAALHKQSGQLRLLERFARLELRDAIGMN